MATDTTDQPATKDAVTIRDAEAGDVAAIADILHAATSAAYKFMAWPHTDKDSHEFVAASMGRWDKVRVAVDGTGKLVAFLCLDGKLIDQLFVAPGHQRRGIGTRMLRDVKAMLPGGLSLFTFQANKPARAFYEKHGFRAVAFGVSEAEGEPDVTYVWAGDGSS